MSLSYEKFSDAEMDVILRDLAKNESLDVSNLFEKYKIEEQKKKTKKKQGGAFRIRQENNKRREEQSKSRDIERLNYYSELKTLSKDILNEISYFKTDYGKLRMKMKLLKIAYEKDDINHMINLYLQVLSDKYDSKKEEKLISRVTKIMNKMDYKRLQFEKLSNELSPLDFYNNYEKKLDDWQIKTLKNIDQGISTLVCAPTSCGKTWLSIYPGLTGKKVLFIVPTQALVYQVGALFTKFGGKIYIISADFCYSNIDNNIVIGTPKDIEDKLPVIGTDFDIIIYDEIHNLSNKVFGNNYERLVKVFRNNQFLALSATIGNPHKLVNWFSKIIDKNVALITYSTRFLNLQRHLFNKKLIKLHPMSCITEDDIGSKLINIPMTPYDCINLYDALKSEFGEEVLELDINNVFPENNARLSLNDSRKYEILLKEKLKELKNTNPIGVNNLIDKYRLTDFKSADVNLYNLFREIKKNKLTPCIVFQQNTQYCKDIFTKLVGYLAKLEEMNYPYHYENLEFAEKCYREAIEQKNSYKKSIKFDNDFVGNKANAIEELLEKKWEKLTTDFQKKWEKQYNRQLLLIEKHGKDNRIKKIQKDNLTKEYEKFMSNISLKHTDVFQKHEDFCLNTSSPMTADQIRNIRNSIRDKLGVNISYTNIFMQGLKRGIGIYTVDMPPVYNMIVQQLAQVGTLGYVIADVSLALGINMPFRSTCILGYQDSLKFDIDNYLQMIGRSGRRGMDREGHIIYANVDWKNLMKGELGEISSTHNNIDNYNTLSILNNSFDELCDGVYDNILDKKAKRSNLRINPCLYKDVTKNILLWKLRSYNQYTEYFIDKLTDKNEEYRINSNIHSMRTLITYIVKLFIDKPLDIDTYLSSDVISPELEFILSILKYNKLPNNDYNLVTSLKKTLNIVKDIHNVVFADENDDYMFISLHLKNLFEFLKNIILQSNILD